MIEGLRKHAVSCYPMESVGFFLDKVYLPQDNTHSDPVNNFSISQEASIFAQENQVSIIHSHTANKSNIDHRTPSYNDMLGRFNTSLPWGIVHCDGLDISEILWFGSINKEDYFGRYYISNVFDCFTLVRDFYFREFNFDIGLHPRPADWFTWNPYYIERTWSTLPFEEVKEPRYGDVIFFNIGSNQTNHLGIFIEEDRFIHHLAGRLSSVDTLPKWYRQVKKIVRLKDAKKTI